jgi:hypothetical protein
MCLKRNKESWATPYLYITSSKRHLLTCHSVFVWARGATLRERASFRVEAVVDEADLLEALVGRHTHADLLPLVDPLKGSKGCDDV